MAKENRILFVEGFDDQHTIWAICEQLKVEETFKIIVPDGEGKIPKKDARQNELGGIDNVLKATRLSLIAGLSAVERIGIVIDADENLNARWQSVSSLLEKAGYKDLPTSPDSDGTIVKQEFLPTFGVWIMPNNKIDGMLEDFLEFLVPDKATSLIWAKAVKCSREVLEEIEEEKRFGDIHLSKAQIHAYLAWQKECGKAFGLSITAKYLQADNPNCENFVNWLKHLFVE
jgi:hypothetical protein